MKQKNKKSGFTLVELLVVIAILAILATVSIVGYTSFLNRAKQSADEAAVAQMNEILQDDEILNGTPNGVGYVVELLVENGYSDYFTTYLTENYLGWYKSENRIVLCQGTAIVYPEEYAKDSFTYDEVYSLNPGIESAEDLQTAISNATKNSVIVLASDNLELTASTSVAGIGGKVGLEISTDITIVGFGNAIVTGAAVAITNNANVTLRNVTFSSPSNASRDASCLYAKNYAGKLVIENCTFTETQWDSIQIVPTTGADITISGCTFVNEETTGYRYIHIQDDGADGNQTLSNLSVKIINNSFGSYTKCSESLIDVDFINYQENLVAYGNTFADTKEEIVNKKGRIFICGAYHWGIDKDITDIMGDSDAYDFMTKSND